MTHREQIAYRVEVMQHWLNGGEVEFCQILSTGWMSAGNPAFEWDKYNYRKKPIKEKRKGWVNVSKNDGMDSVYPSQKLADSGATGNRIACVEIEYEFEVPQK